MMNEQIVCEIRNGYSVTDNMQLLYESNLPLIKKFIKPFAAYEPMEACYKKVILGYVKQYSIMKHLQMCALCPMLNTG